MSRSATPENDITPAEMDEASTREFIRQWNLYTKLLHCKREHDHPHSHFSTTRNYVLPYVRCSGNEPKWNYDAVYTSSLKPKYYLHAIETSSTNEAEDLRKFLNAAVETSRRELWVDRFWFRNTVGKGGYSTRARDAKREAHKQRIEQRLQLSTGDTSALAAIRTMRSQGETSPAIDWTPLVRLPNEIQTMICQYAIQDTSCACPYCYDKDAIRRLYNLSTETRDNLMKVIELEGNHAMKWFVGMDPASLTKPL